ncbi:MAG: efflux RND transporter periplasmic adaptor subunit [Phycisphaerales bacterium]
MNQIKTPGWPAIVAELSAAAGDERAFPSVLLAAMGRVTGARQAALLAPAPPGESTGPGEVRATLVWPAVDGEAADEALQEPDVIRIAAAGVLASGESKVMAIGGASDALYGGEAGGGFVLCVPVGRLEDDDRPRPAAAAVLLLDGRSQQALQTTMALAELLAGYAHLGAARQQLARTRASASALDLATRLIGSINSARGFRGAALQLVNDLCRALKADRVALGWRGGRAGANATGDGVVAERDATPVRVVALSDTEQVDRRMAMVRKLAAAMDECVDQEQAVAYPLPDAPRGEEPDPVLARAVTQAHRELTAGNAHLKVISVPVRDGDETIGVVTIESAAPGQSIDPRTVELLQATLDLVGPVLRVRRSDDRPIPARAADAVRAAGAWAVGPRHTWWKLAALAVLALSAVVVFVRVPYRIEAPVSLKPMERRVIAAPFDGTVRSVSARAKAGESVEAGEVLVRLDTSELELSAAEARGQLRQAQAQADEAMRRGQGGERQQAEARAEQARARLELFERRIEQAEIRAPMAGTIITGDLSERVGATLTRGDPLFEIAPLDTMRVVARVDDRDIGLIMTRIAEMREEDEAGAMVGSVATRAYPDRRFPLRVERVVPLARAEGGLNAFEVHAALEHGAAWMRPGMEGLAKLEVGDRTLLWIGSRRIVDTLRLWLWW